MVLCVSNGIQLLSSIGQCDAQYLDVPGSIPNNNEKTLIRPITINSFMTC